MKILLTPETKESIVLQYKNGKNIAELATSSSVSERTIYRWSKIYDGTVESLKPKSSTPKCRHPKCMPEEEEKRIIEIVSANPYITYLELSNLLGTNRSVAVLSRKVKKLLKERKNIAPAKKYDYHSAFNSQLVMQINKFDILRGNIENSFYLIEVLPDLYLRKDTGQYPVCFTPFYSVALKFKEKNDADDFCESLICDNMKWIPQVKYVHEL